MSSTGKVRVIISDGRQPFTCESRAKLLTDPACQAALRKFRDEICPDTGFAHPVQLYCGCRLEGRPLRISIVEEHHRIFPRAWPGEQEFHAATCETVGNGANVSGDGSGATINPTSRSWVFERAMDTAYGWQLLNHSPSHARFCLDLEAALKAGLANDPCFAGLLCGVGLVENSPVDEGTMFPKGVEISMRRFHADGTPYEEIWWAPPGIPLDMRTDPRGRAFPGLHLVAGLWPEGGSLAALHAWLVYAGAAALHTSGSLWESLVMDGLKQAGVAFIKPPSEKFMQTCDHPDWSDLFACLVAVRVWPDLAVKLAQGYCVLEVAGMDTPAYLADLAVKTMKLLRLERERGLEWAILKPDGDRLVVDRRSAKLTIVGVLEDLRRSSV